MKLELRVSTRMTAKGEDNCIRLTPKKKAALKAIVGQQLVLTTDSGDKVPVEVKDTLLEDFLLGDDAAYVSQEVFDKTLGLRKNLGEISVGCDPEFVFLNDLRHVVPANDFLAFEGEIGHDGPQAELRPKPGTHEVAVTENLRELIKRIDKLSKACGGKIYPEAHSCWEGLSLGFHIHIGAPKELTTLAAPHAKKFIEAYIDVLDYFVGATALLLEDTNARRLGGSKFGKPGDYRLKGGTIEYRNPGGFHLRHPGYTAGIMGLALCVSRTVFAEAGEVSRGWRELGNCASFEFMRKRFNLPDRGTIRWALLDPSKRAAVDLIPNIIHQLSGLQHFDNHKDSIKEYFGMVAKNAQFTPSILHNWL